MLLIGCPQNKSVLIYRAGASTLINRPGVIAYACCLLGFPTCDKAAVQVASPRLDCVAIVWPGHSDQPACGGRAQAQQRVHVQARVRASAAQAACVTRPNVPVPGWRQAAARRGACGSRAWRFERIPLGRQLRRPAPGLPAVRATWYVMARPQLPP